MISISGDAVKEVGVGAVVLAVSAEELAKHIGKAIKHGLQVYEDKKTLQEIREFEQLHAKHCMDIPYDENRKRVSLDFIFKEANQKIAPTKDEKSDEEKVQKEQLANSKSGDIPVPKQAELLSDQTLKTLEEANPKHDYLLTGYERRIKRAIAIARQYKRLRIEVGEKVPRELFNAHTWDGKDTGTAEDPVSAVLDWFVLMLQVHCYSSKGDDYIIQVLTALKKFVLDFAGLERKDVNRDEHMRTVADQIQSAITARIEHQRIQLLSDKLPEFGSETRINSDQLLRNTIKLFVKPELDRDGKKRATERWKRVDEADLHDIVQGYIEQTYDDKQKPIDLAQDKIPCFAAWIIQNAVDLNNFYDRIPYNPLNVINRQFLTELPSNPKRETYTLHILQSDQKLEKNTIYVRQEGDKLRYQLAIPKKDFLHKDTSVSGEIPLYELDLDPKTSVPKTELDKLLPNIITCIVHRGHIPVDIDPKTLERLRKEYFDKYENLLTRKAGHPHKGSNKVELEKLEDYEILDSIYVIQQLSKLQSLYTTYQMHLAYLENEAIQMGNKYLQNDLTHNTAVFETLADLYKLLDDQCRICLAKLQQIEQRSGSGEFGVHRDNLSDIKKSINNISTSLSTQVTLMTELHKKRSDEVHIRLNSSDLLEQKKAEDRENSNMTAFCQGVTLAYEKKYNVPPRKRFAKTNKVTAQTVAPTSPSTEFKTNGNINGGLHTPKNTLHPVPPPVTTTTPHPVNTSDSNHVDPHHLTNSHSANDTTHTTSHSNANSSTTIAPPTNMHKQPDGKDIKSSETNTTPPSLNTPPVQPPIALKTPLQEVGHTYVDEKDKELRKKYKKLYDSLQSMQDDAEKMAEEDDQQRKEKAKEMSRLVDELAKATLSYMNVDPTADRKKAVEGFQTNIKTILEGGNKDLIDAHKFKFFKIIKDIYEYIISLGKSAKQKGGFFQTHSREQLQEFKQTADATTNDTLLTNTTLPTANPVNGPSN